jgi:hypothetical protein
MPKQENIDALQRAALRFKVEDLEGRLALCSNSVIQHGFSSRIRLGVPGLRDQLHESFESPSRHEDRD